MVAICGKDCFIRVRRRVRLASSSRPATDDSREETDTSFGCQLVMASSLELEMSYATKCSVSEEMRRRCQPMSRNQKKKKIPSFQFLDGKTGPIHYRRIDRYF